MSERNVGAGEGSRARRVLRRFRWPLILLAVYLVGEQLFARLASDDGMFFPELAGEGLAVIALGAALLALRLVVYGLLPGVVTYQLVGLAWDAARARRSRGPGPCERGVD